MEFNKLIAKALQVRDGYDKRNLKDGRNRWETTEYYQALVGDVGDLGKLIMAKHNYRDVKDGGDVNEKLTHELGDCLWAILVIADTLNIDLEATFNQTMDEIIKRDNL